MTVSWKEVRQKLDQKSACLAARRSHLEERISEADDDLKANMLELEKQGLKKEKELVRSFQEYAQRELRSENRREQRGVTVERIDRS